MYAKLRAEIEKEKAAFTSAKESPSVDIDLKQKIAGLSFKLHLTNSKWWLKPVKSDGSVSSQNIGGNLEKLRDSIDSYLSTCVDATTVTELDDMDAASPPPSASRRASAPPGASPRGSSRKRSRAQEDDDLERALNERIEEYKQFLRRKHRFEVFKKFVDEHPKHLQKEERYFSELDRRLTTTEPDMSDAEQMQVMVDKLLEYFNRTRELAEGGNDTDPDSDAERHVSDEEEE